VASFSRVVGDLYVPDLEPEGATIVGFYALGISFFVFDHLASTLCGPTVSTINASFSSFARAPPLALTARLLLESLLSCLCSLLLRPCLFCIFTRTIGWHLHVVSWVSSAACSRAGQRSQDQPASR
jgi:hypothetical protein